VSRARGILGATAAIALMASAAVDLHAQPLDQALARVAAAWHAGDAARIAALGARAGISLDVDGSFVGPLGSRQAAAALRRLFDQHESTAARATMTRTVGGDPPRAFGEIAWTSRSRGTSIPEQAKLFVAFVREGDSWRITEIRLLR
jgi:ketosteroid isomerase-like protein